LEECSTELALLADLSAALGCDLSNQDGHEQGDGANQTMNSGTLGSRFVTTAAVNAVSVAMNALPRAMS